LSIYYVMAIVLIPKLLSISCTLTVVHDHLLGFDRTTGQWIHTGYGSEDMRHFPYGLDVTASPDIAASMQMSNETDLSINQSSTTDGRDAYGGAGDFKSHWGDGNTWHELGLFENGITLESALASQKEHFITLINIPTGMTLHFKAFITALSDSFATRWDSQTVYGRMDPVSSFQGTQRVVSIRWEVVSASVEEGIDNLRKCTNFAKMLYPTQTIRGSATSIKSPPMMAIKFTNHVSQGPADTNRALTGTINGFNFNPEFGSGGPGFFEVDEEDPRLGGESV